MFTLIGVMLTSLILFALLLCFYAVSVVCDDHLVPVIVVVIEQMKIPEDIAGVTLVAFGSAAPELFLNMVAAAEKESDLSLPAVLGSAIIAFGLIPPLCLLCTDEKEVTLKSWPIIRETGFYVFGLVTFLFSIIDGELDEIEALALVFVYVLYVSFVIVFYVYSGGGSLPAQEALSVEERAATAPALFLIGAKGSSDEFDRLVDDSSSSPSKQHNHQQHRSYEVHFRDDDTNINLGLSPRANISVSPAASAGAGAGAGAGTARMGDKVMSWEGEDVEEVISAQNPSWRKTIVHVWEQVTAPIHSLISAVFPHLVPPTSTENEVVMNCIVAAGLASSGAATAEEGASGKSSQERKDDDMFLSLSDDFSSHPPPSNVSASHSVPLWRAVVVLAMSIASMGLLAFLIICLCQQLVVYIDVGTTTIGATLVALGSEIPDTISSIALARSGYNDGAMAGAIGSQVINISLGIGLPSLLSALANGGTQIIDPSQAKSLWLLTSLLFVIIAGYIATTLPIFRVLSCTATHYTTIRRPGAWFLLALWACVYAAFIFLNESAKQQGGGVV